MNSRFASLNSIKKEVPLLKDHFISQLKKTADGFSFYTGSDEIQCSILVNAAGLWAPQVRSQLGLTNLTSHFVKGNYLRYQSPIDTKHLLYPIPPQDLQGLGVHLTFNHQNEFRFGPDTEVVDDVDYALSNNIHSKMRPSIDRLFKNIDHSKITEDYCGIRPKIKSKGTLYSDFWIGNQQVHGIKNYYEFCGIESPGLTSAPALARWVVDQI